LSSTDRRAAWTIRSRQAMSSINYWLATAGYDGHDRSLLMRIYLLYLALFFSGWAFAVMLYLSNLLANGLSPFLASLGLSLVGFATAIGTTLLVLGHLSRVYSATHRSPLVFSGDDAQLICQTPADRRFVALAWVLGEWASAALPILAAAITMSFALLDLDITAGASTLSVEHVAIAALRASSIIMPLHLGLYVSACAVGVYRLQRNAQRKKVMQFIRVLYSVLAFGTCAALLASAPFGPSSTVFQPILSLVTLPIRSALHQASWPLGLALSMACAAASLALIWHLSFELNLSRAAQEAHNYQSQRVAARIGDSQRLRELADRERLGSAHAPSAIPTRSGAWMLTWKDTLQTLRTLTISRLWPWLAIALWAFAGALVKDRVALVGVGVCWTILVSQRTTARLKDDLGNWWLLNSLPLSGRRVIFHELARPAATVVTITWLAVCLAHVLGPTIPRAVVMAVPVIVAGIASSSAYDMLRRSDASMLLAGRQPDFGMLGLASAVLCGASPASIAFFAADHAVSPFLALLAVFLTGIILAAGFLCLSERQLRRVAWVRSFPAVRAA
jgi:hypothetical protein